MTLEERLARAFLEEHPGEAARALERLAPEPRAAVIREVPAEAALALRRMLSAPAADALSRLSDSEAASAVARLPVDTTIGLLRRMPADIAQRVIGGLPRDQQEALRRVLRYPEGTAGALMDPAALAVPDDIAAAEARLRLRREPRGLLHYVYVVDRAGVLVGVFDIPELMRARPRDAIRGFMQERVDHIPAWTPAAAVRTHPGWRSYHAMPVTDDERRLVGAVRYQTLRRLEEEVDSGRSQQSAAVTAGALGELFHLGIAGLVEGVAATAAPRNPLPGKGKGETR